MPSTPVVSHRIVRQCPDTGPCRSRRVGNAGAAVAEELCAVTWWISPYTSPTGVNAWPIRRPVAEGVAGRVKPDVMGTQEGCIRS